MSKTQAVAKKKARGLLKSIGQRLDDKKTIKELSADNKDSLHRIDRRKVTMQKGLTAGEDATGTLGATMVPSSSQLAKINEFTKIDATADNVVAFPTNAMNDLYDRDDEKFTTDCVKEFAALPQPFSPIGKSYMVDHEYKMANAKGRIYDVGTKKIDGALFLTPEVYIPKTAQFADFIEGIDFGINNFVSVGVVIDKNACSICSAPVYTSSWSGWTWCAAGHEKGYYYVPGQEEDDGWGFYLPVDSHTKGAVMARVDMFDPIDFYELSQVFLGAQFYAELAKKPGFKGIVKAASANSVPLLGLSSKEASVIEMPHANEKLHEARKLYTIESSKDGTSRWTDKSGLVWTYDPDDDEVRSLGKAMTTEEDDMKKSKLEDRVDTLTALIVTLSGMAEEDDHVETVTALEADMDKITAALEADDPVEAETLLDAAELSAEELEAELSEEEDEEDEIVPPKSAKSGKAKEEDSDEDDEEEDDEEEDEPHVNETDEQKTILRAAQAAKLPTDILTNWKGKTLASLLTDIAKEIRSARKQLAVLEPKAAIADQAVKDAEAEAIHWYAVSRRDAKHPEKGVNVDLAQKLVDRCDGDIDLIKELGKEWRDDARKLFPKVARSVVEDNPNKPDDPAKLPEQMTEKTQDDDVVQRLHSR